ncbi:ABC transporter ATP-binding protein [Clostridium sp. FP1]|uniref:ABC transporter ATP-binding protein n=1 Tax=Clostridium sp. FP1 TaxID=2724076 RepID=UPI0013E90D83|nr:ATP-binding cassette domain-containing protein [Clostridium sp. FP1]MBZ9634858.1 ATP-binding cassette domain-containing protein [Clostridium sp. FP1]
MIRVENLRKEFKSGVINRRIVKAIDEVSFEIEEGETLGLVGESGCGKSTLSRVILKLIKADGGKIFFQGKDISNYSFSKMRELRGKMQIIFQHPDSSLSPKKTIENSLIEPLKIHKIYKKGKSEELIKHYLKYVGLTYDILSRYPHQVSGGQIQRVVIARALILNPKFIILDEPTSMLDVSVQAKLIQVLKKAQREFGITYLFISHDIDLVRVVSDKIAIMLNGRIVETLKADSIYEDATHEYTKRLIENFVNF